MNKNFSQLIPNLKFLSICKKAQDLSSFEGFYQVILDYEDEFIQFCKEFKKEENRRFLKWRTELQGGQRKVRTTGAAMNV